MMNVVALCLVSTSLATAGVWSPRPKKPNNGDGLIVKEGHRMVVVEYDQEGKPITKVSISPQDKSRLRLDTDQLKEAASVLPNLGQGLSTSKSHPDEGGKGQWRSPRELICDAYGKCKHKIVDALGRTKESVSEAAHDVAEKTKETMEKARDVMETAKEAVSEKAQEVAQKAKETKEKAKGVVSEKEHHVTEKTKEAAHESQDASNKAKRKAHNLAEKTRETAHEAVNKKKKAEEVAKEAYEKAKETLQHMAREVEGQARETAEQAKEAVKDAKELGKTIGTHVAKNVSGFFATIRKQAGTTMIQIVSGMALNPVSGVVCLVAFSTTYGTSVWVTFILSYVLVGALPRQQFGVVQSKIYTVYFRTMAWGIGTALLGYMATDRGRAFSGMAE